MKVSAGKYIQLFSTTIYVEMRMQMFSQRHWKKASSYLHTCCIYLNFKALKTNFLIQLPISGSWSSMNTELEWHWLFYTRTLCICASSVLLSLVCSGKRWGHVFPRTNQDLTLELWRRVHSGIPGYKPHLLIFCINNVTWLTSEEFSKARMDTDLSQ